MVKLAMLVGALVPGWLRNTTCVPGWHGCLPMHQPTRGQWAFCPVHNCIMEVSPVHEE